MGWNGGWRPNKARFDQDVRNPAHETHGVIKTSGIGEIRREPVGCTYYIARA